MTRAVLLVLLAVILVWTAASVVRIRIFSGRAGNLIRTTVPFERQGSNQQKVLILGDSLAYGTGTSAPEKSVAGLVAAHYPGATVTNKSVNGKRTQDLAEEVKQLEGQYDLILVIIGGNDVLRPWIDLNESANNLETIYEAASEHSQKVIAMTTGNFRYTTLFLWPLNLYYEQRSVKLRDHAVATAAKFSNVTYVNIVEWNKKMPFDHLKEAPDHLHLSDDGANYWYQAILETNTLPSK